MGRLQRFIRRLPPEEWEPLWKAAQKEISPQSQTLLATLRSSRSPIPLRGSAKEVAQRVERWIWRYMQVQESFRYPPYKSPPTTLLLYGAQVYYRAGLESEAFQILRQAQKQIEWPIQELLMEVRWHKMKGRFKAATRVLYELERVALHLYQSVQQHRLQLLLIRLFREHGGSYTASAQRLLRRLSTLRRWQTPLPIDPKARATEKNLRGTYALMQGDPQQAFHWYIPEADLPTSEATSLVLNAWLCQIYLKDSPASIASLLQELPHREFPEYLKAVLAERCLLTMLHYGHPKDLQRLRPWMQRTANYASTSGASASLLTLQLEWISGEKSSYRSRLSFLAQESLTPTEKLQFHLVSLLLAVESGDLREIIQGFQRGESFLRKNRSKFASAPLLGRLIRKLYTVRLRSHALRQVARAWDTHLIEYPAERLFWMHTILPHWIEARLKTESLEAYYQSRPSSADLISQIEEFVKNILTPLPPP